MYIRQKTFERGFRSDQDSRILDKYVKNETCLDWLKEITLKIKQVILENIRIDRTDREKSNKVLIYK